MTLWGSYLIMHQKGLIKNWYNLSVVSVDDGKFLSSKNASNIQDTRTRRKAPFFCIIMKNLELVAVKIKSITVDGLDSTVTLIEMLKKLHFDLIMLSGITFGGFNIINTDFLFRYFKKPIIVISNSKPNNFLIKKALKLHFTDWKKRFGFIVRLGSLHCIKTVYNNPIYFEVIGLNYKKARRIIRELTFIGKHPEPIRVIQLLAQDLS